LCTYSFVIVNISVFHKTELYIISSVRQAPFPAWVLKTFRDGRVLNGFLYVISPTTGMIPNWNRIKRLSRNLGSWKYLVALRRLKMWEMIVWITGLLGFGPENMVFTESSVHLVIHKVT
jgi:hypothetical protein